MSRNIHATAAVLLSGNRNTYDSGQLVSDLLPCIVTPLQLTATAWRSSSSNGPFQQQQQQQQQPNLQICSRNAYTDQPYSNCNLFPIQNGVPVTVNVPIPRDPTTPAQIVLLGDNFVGKYGAIFVQDIIVDGDIVPDCTVITSFPRKQHYDKQHLQQSKHLIPLNNFQDSSSFVKNHELSPMQKVFNLRQPSKLQSAASSISDSLIVECLKLSCNPAQKECGWKTGTPGWVASRGIDNLSNPLTSITAPPDGTNAFLVTSFSSAHFTMCIDALSKGCFYSKINVSKDDDLQANRRWNFQCTKLPIGTYKIYISAENNESNQGDIGFVPLRLSQDLAGNDPIC
ncbi:hypothetical protein DINM_020675 [Dirofilaria immitis]|nr:hypothetical protein [Dirofilaria immitis]